MVDDQISQARTRNAKAAALDDERVTEAMNAVVDAVGGATDAFTRAAARRVFDHVEW